MMQMHSNAATGKAAVALLNVVQPTADGNESFL